MPDAKKTDLATWLIAIVPIILAIIVGIVGYTSTTEHVAEAQSCCVRAQDEIKSIKDDLTQIKIDGARTRQILEDMASRNRK